MQVNVLETLSTFTCIEVLHNNDSHCFFKSVFWYILLYSVWYNNHCDSFVKSGLLSILLEQNAKHILYVDLRYLYGLIFITAF
jgi:hypothetical protein